MLKSYTSNPDLSTLPGQNCPRLQGHGHLGISLSSKHRSEPFLVFSPCSNSFFPQSGEFRIPHSPWDNPTLTLPSALWPLFPFWLQLSHLQEPHAGGPRLKLRTSHCTNGNSSPPPSWEQASHSPQISGLKSLPAQAYGWRRGSVFLQGILQPCPYKRMGIQTLKKHQNCKMQTRPTSTEEEGGHALRGTGWDRAF